MTRKHSYVTITDQFCGAGGSSLAAVARGIAALRASEPAARQMTLWEGA